jgi:pimeloyl-ACP methyl ester carboxylesterase
MSAAATPVAYEEFPTFFDVDGTTLFGIVTRPRTGDGRTGMILIPGGGLPLNVNRNRVTVRMCRGLAALGYTTLRMDYHGTGESDGVIDRFHLGHPFVADVAAGVDHLRSLGVDEVVVVGLTCFGARTALATAAEREDVAEVVAMATPMRDFQMGEGHRLKAAMRKSVWRYALEAFRPRTIRGLFDRHTRRQYRDHFRTKRKVVAARASRVISASKTASTEIEPVSPRLIRALDRLVDRRVPMLWVYGEDEEYYGEFQAARTDGLKRVLDRAGPLLTVRTVPGKVHGLARLDVQDAVTDVLFEWARDRAAASAPAGTAVPSRAEG